MNYENDFARGTTVQNATDMINDESRRVVNEEGYTSSHDDLHINGELGNAAACYALTDEMIGFINKNLGLENDISISVFPFDSIDLKRNPKNRIKDLIKAGQLIRAEINRLIRIENGD